MTSTGKVIRWIY